MWEGEGQILKQCEKDMGKFAGSQKRPAEQKEFFPNEKHTCSSLLLPILPPIQEKEVQQVVPTCSLLSR